MQRVLLVDNSDRDVRRLGELLAKDSIELEFCSSGSDAERLLLSRTGDFGVAVVLWELTGTVSGSDLLIKSRKLRPEMPVVVISELLDYSLATRARSFGARRFLLKPIDSEEFLTCIHSLLDANDPLSPVLEKLRERIIGQSPALQDTLKKVANIIPHRDTCVLLSGETGTGKELFARAIHELGPRASKPWVAVNMGGMPPTLIESALFGHERGAFTGADSRHVGYFEEAGEGTVFLDEIGNLEVPLQNKLLRVLQERKFRRLGGTNDIDFRAGLVSATNRDLAQAVNDGSFGRDLFHRLAEFTIQVPPLRERKGDIDLLLDYFIDKHGQGRQVRFAPSALAILRTYPFNGNVRQLERLVTAALKQNSGTQFTDDDFSIDELRKLEAPNGSQPAATTDISVQNVPVAGDALVDELLGALPSGWSTLGYSEAATLLKQAFDRVYLKRTVERSHYNISKAARDLGIDTKTLRKRWKQSGLPPLSGAEDSGVD